MPRTGSPRLYPNYEFPGIYQIVNVINGKRYVGQAQNITVRFREHRRKRNGLPGSNQFSLLYQAFRKYGIEAFEFSVLERVEDIASLNERERFWIHSLDVCNRAIGYNICSEPGTTRGWQHKEETKEKIRVSARKRTGARNPFFGKQHSEETKAKIGNANTGKIRTEQTKEKLKIARKRTVINQMKAVEQIDPASKDVIRIWPSISSACRELGISPATLVGCCKGKRGRRTAKGSVWRYAAA